MEGEELLKKAHAQGAAAGQIAISEFVLKSYGHTLDPRLTRFLEKVKADCYETIGGILEQPAEDIALKVTRMVDEHVTITD